MYTSNWVDVGSRFSVKSIVYLAYVSSLLSFALSCMVGVVTRCARKDKEVENSGLALYCKQIIMSNYQLLGNKSALIIYLRNHMSRWFVEPICLYKEANNVQCFFSDSHYYFSSKRNAAKERKDILCQPVCALWAHGAPDKRRFPSGTCSAELPGVTWTRLIRTGRTSLTRSLYGGILVIVDSDVACWAVPTVWLSQFCTEKNLTTVVTGTSDAVACDFVVIIVLSILRRVQKFIHITCFLGLQARDAYLEGTVHATYWKQRVNAK